MTVNPADLIRSLNELNDLKFLIILPQLTLFLIIGFLVWLSPKVINIFKEISVSLAELKEFFIQSKQENRQLVTLINEIRSNEALKIEKLNVLKGDMDEIKDSLRDVGDSVHELDKNIYRYQRDCALHGNVKQDRITGGAE